MSRFIINEKLYDTEKMAHIGTVKKWYRNEFYTQLMKEERGTMRNCELYRSEKGNHLIVREECGILYGEAIEESEAKRLLMKYDYENYRKIYGDLEEA